MNIRKQTSYHKNTPIAFSFAYYKSFRYPYCEKPFILVFIRCWIVLVCSCLKVHYLPYPNQLCTALQTPVSFELMSNRKWRYGWTCTWVCHCVCLEITFAVRMSHLWFLRIWLSEYLVSKSNTLGQTLRQTNRHFPHLLSYVCVCYPSGVFPLP